MNIVLHNFFFPKKCLSSILLAWMLLLGQCIYLSKSLEHGKICDELFYWDTLRVVMFIGEDNLTARMTWKSLHCVLMVHFLYWQCLSQWFCCNSKPFSPTLQWTFYFFPLTIHSWAFLMITYWLHYLKNLKEVQIASTE